MTFPRTILKDSAGRVFFLPNSTLLSSKVVNYSQSGYIEISVNITLPPDLPLTQARNTILFSAGCPSKDPAEYQNGKNGTNSMVIHDPPSARIGITDDLPRTVLTKSPVLRHRAIG
jgi:hypothetical protein